MTQNIPLLIKECSIFSSLDIEVCEKISDMFEVVELEENDILFKQGEPSFYVYVLTKGLLVSVISHSNGTQFIGSIESGETIGELGVISGEVRMMTLQAAQECKLLKISNEDFIKISKQYPSILFSILKPLVKRNQNNLKSNFYQKPCRYVGLLLQQSLVENNFILDIIDKHSPIKKNFIIIDNADIQKNNQNILKILSEYEQIYETIVIIFEKKDSILNRIVLQKSEAIYAFFDVDKDKNDDIFFHQILNDPENKSRIKFEMVLCHRLEKSTPHSTINWLLRGSFFQHHHVRLNNANDIQRLIRFLTGNAIGVVLGSGGGRGALHIGVLKALQTFGIPVDAVGGTSIGAIIGALYSLAPNDENFMQEQISKFYSQVFPFIIPQDLTFPIVSLLDGKRLNTAIYKIFQDHQIEDLWSTFFCLTSNISMGREEVHTIGPIAEWVRGSSAIPGIMPPLTMSGDIHYDGALCNSIPADIMRNVVGINGKIITIDLSISYRHSQNYHLPRVFRFRDYFFDKIKRNKSFTVPPFFDTFYKTLSFGSLTRDRENSRLSDIVIHPDLTQFSMFSLRWEQVQELIRLGYQEVANLAELWEYEPDQGKLLKK